MTDTVYHFDTSHLESNRDYLNDMRASVRQSARNVQRAYDNAAHHEKLRRWYLLRTLLLEANLTEQLAGPDADHVGQPQFPPRPSATPRFVVLVHATGSSLVIHDQVDGTDLPLSPVDMADEPIIQRVADELNYWRAGAVLRVPPTPELPAWFKYAKMEAPRRRGADVDTQTEPHEFVDSGDRDRDSGEAICGYPRADGTRCGAASGSTAHLDYLRRHRDTVEAWPPSPYKIEVYRALGWEYPQHA